MRETKHNLNLRKPLALALGLLVSAAAVTAAQAESLFHANATYQAQTPLAPRSLYTPPIARNVGDIVTVLIDETSEMNAQASLEINRSQTLDGSPTGPWNTLVNWAIDKLPFKTGSLNEKLSAPTFTNAGSSNLLNSGAESKRKTELTDSIACQVVQVLPNGDLMIQGQKSVTVNKERQDLMVTGIVRPFYLDRNNQISSQKVANMQMIQGGKGVISRQQGDGVANKIYQFFN